MSACTLWHEPAIYEVSWDYDIPNIWKNNPNVPNHQPVMNGRLLNGDVMGLPHKMAGLEIDFMENANL